MFGFIFEWFLKCIIDFYIFGFSKVLLNLPHDLILLKVFSYVIDFYTQIYFTAHFKNIYKHKSFYLQISFNRNQF